MSDPTKQERTEEFMRKSLLGEELINTQFHLFSARSSASDRVVEPRVLCANNDILAKTSTYFLDLLSSDIDSSDPSLFDLTDENEVPNDLRMDDYGYGSDSDLDEYQFTSFSKANTGSRSGDDNELSGGGSELVGSDGLVTEQLGVDEPLSVTKDGTELTENDETAVQEAPDSKKLRKDAAMRLQSSGSRHILIKDTAFQTWYTLLNYLYTGRITVLPLSSSTPGGKPRECSMNSLDRPRCSAKSMYRLACKTGLDDLRSKTFSFIRNHLTEQNILKELGSSVVSGHPELLEMELDVLYSHIASPVVVAGFPAFARRIANGELPHGADVIIGIHTRILKKPHPVPLKFAPILPLTTPTLSNPVEPAKVFEDGADASHVEKPEVAAATTAARAPESNGSTTSGPSSVLANTTPVSTAASKKPGAKVPRVSLPTSIFASGPTTTSSSMPAPTSNTPAAAPIFSTATLGPTPAPAPASSTAASTPASTATVPPFGSSSAQSFGKPPPAPTSSTTSPFPDSNPTPTLTPSTAAPFFRFSATPAFSSTTPAAASSSTGSTVTSDPAATFTSLFAASMSGSNPPRARAVAPFFGSGQAAGETGSQSFLAFSFAQRDDNTTDNQKTSAVNHFAFGPPPSNS